VGPAGVGKSRLAEAVVSRAACAFPYGARIVNLRGVLRLGEVVEAISASLSEPKASPKPGNTLPELVELLQDRTTLLALDNCKYLHAEVTKLILALLPSCPDLRIMVTGGGPLGIYGEQLFAVRPLPVPPPNAQLSVEELAKVPSVALFLQHGAAVRPTFALTAGNASAVAELCRRLDGLPLAIELAASRLKLLQPEELLAQASSGFMQEALGSDWEMLPQEAQHLFACLGIFSGSFTLQSAEAIANVARAPFELLIDRNFVQVDERFSGEMRFWMLRTTRAFALEKLVEMGSLEAVSLRYADYFRERFHTLRAAATDRKQWLSTLDLERDEIEGVVARLIGAGRGAEAMSFTASLTPYWLAQGQAGLGLKLLNHAIQLGEEPAGKATAEALRALGELSAHSGPVAEATRYHRRALDLYLVLGDAAGALAVTHQLGLTSYLAGDLEAAEALLTLAVKEYDTTGNISGYAIGALDLAATQVATGELQAAAESVAGALSALGDSADSYTQALAYVRLAEIAVATGNLPDAENHCTTAICAMALHRGWGGLALCLELLAAVMADDGLHRYTRAVRLLAAAQVCRERNQFPVPVPHQGFVQGLAYRLRDKVGGPAYAEHLRAGRALSLAGVLSEHRGTLAASRPDPRLTQRQRQVAELVACGLTNRAIASRLGIAEWTVVNHVREVLRKLHFSSRVHIARWFAEQNELGGE
jgi:predicted ATPase/DNA-binding CsgD family transcriptional regulator